MKPVKIRKIGREQILAIPASLAKNLQAEYVTVRLDETGRLIYTPLQEPTE